MRVRLDKRAKLLEQGRAPYPVSVPRTHSLAEVRQGWGHLGTGEETDDDKLAIERVVTPITVPSMTFGGVKIVSWFRKPPFVMDCHLALGLTTFGKDLYELGVRELTFSSIYRYTKVRVGGRTKNTLSRHALGLAIDVRSVTDADGRVAVVAADYKLDDPLLLRLEDFLNDAGGFRTVLTPKNDPISHHDHFHVEVKLEY